MKDLRAPESAGVLAAFGPSTAGGVRAGGAGARVLLAFDFDGTLAPIVSDRDAAGMRSPTRALFAEVCGLYPCAVISGRALNDVRARLAPAEVTYVVGNHGLESDRQFGAFEVDVARVRAFLEQALRDLDGVDVEDKRQSLSVHYRRSAEPVAAEMSIRAALAASPVRMHIVPGKFVVNVVPAGGPHKGDALADLARREDAELVLFVGDDATDEDAFLLRWPNAVVSIRVGESSTSAARYFLRDQEDIDWLLAELIRLGRLRDPR